MPVCEIDHNGQKYKVSVTERGKIDNAFSCHKINPTHLASIGPRAFDSTYDLDVQQGAGPQRKRYEACTVAELREKCIKRRIAHKGLRKAELIAKLRR
jgi:hypothetical protein